MVCLGTYTASRVAEQVRAGIQSIGQGQRYAGLAIGLTPVQVYRYILLPVAYRIIVPPLTSDFLGIFKNSSLALTIGVLELTAQTRQIEEYTFQGFEAFTTATVLYCLVTFIVMIAMRVVENRTAHSRHDLAGGEIACPAASTIRLSSGTSPFCGRGCSSPSC